MEEGQEDIPKDQASTHYKELCAPDEVSMSPCIKGIYLAGEYMVAF